MRALWRCFLLVLSIFALQIGVFSPASANSKYAAIVVHADSGDVLFARDADASRYPASLTKMMTLYLLFEELDAGRLTLDTEMTVSAQAAAQPPSKLGLVAGSKIKVETAIKALTVKSANDAAVAIAETISGSEWRFAQKMTDKARALGMSRTTFRNASGLPNTKQRTTARDLATLGRRLAQDFPQYYSYFAAPNLAWNGRTYATHNQLVKSYQGTDGLKTGYTRVSGFNLATSVKRDGVRLVGIVLGGRSVRTRDAHMRQILDGAYAALKSDPMLIASLHRATPTPRIKPTLLAELERQRAVPSVADNDAIRTAIVAAAGDLRAEDDASDDTIGLLAATALQGDLNEFEAAKLAATDPGAEGVIGEGDSEAAPAGFSVQIGAYSTQEFAQSELARAATMARVSADRPRAVQAMATPTGGQLYRARFTALTAQEADMVCATLTAKGQSCFVVSEAAPTAP